MGKCEACVHYGVCVKLRKPALYGIKKEVGCDTHLEVVRCKDCKHYTSSSGCIGIMPGYGFDVKPDDFCSYGERREGE